MQLSFRGSIVPAVRPSAWKPLCFGWACCLSTAVPPLMVIASSYDSFCGLFFRTHANFVFSVCNEELLENVDFQGTDIAELQSPDVDHCQHLCTQHPTCLFFTFLRSLWTTDDRYYSWMNAEVKENAWIETERNADYFYMYYKEKNSSEVQTFNLKK